MAETSAEFLERVVSMLLDLARDKVLPKIDSSTLRAALQQIIEFGPEGVRGRLHIPHYWAVFYHDGRKGFSAPAGHKLVFYADPRDDPRLRGGRPVTKADVRPLTRAEFLAGLKKNRERRAKGGPPFMFVLDSVGPADHHPFFTEGMIGFSDEAGPAVLRETDAHIRQIAAENSESGRVIFRLG